MTTPPPRPVRPVVRQVIAEGLVSDRLGQLERAAGVVGHGQAAPRGVGVASVKAT